MSTEYPTHPNVRAFTTIVPIIFTDESETDEEEDYDTNQDFDERFESRDNFTSYVKQRPRGLHPPSQVISAQSLPNLLISEQNGDNTDSMYTTSEDNLQSFPSRKKSVGGTISTAESKTSTLVGSIMVFIFNTTF